MGTAGSKYGNDHNAGLGGLWRSLTSIPGDAKDDFNQWGSAIVYGTVVVVAGFVLLIGYSYASGKQNIAQTVTAVGDAGSKLTPMGKAAAKAI